MRQAVCLVALLALAVPPAAAQHEHGPGGAVVVAHDSPPDGREFVGNLAHFGIVTLGDDLVPDFHQQNHIRVTENGAVLLETTPDSGHDYDGVALFDVAFPVAGRYTVEALDEAGKPLATFSGTVVDAAAAAATGTAPTSAELDLLKPPRPDGSPIEVAAGVPTDFEYATRRVAAAVEGGDAAPSQDIHLLEHTDAWFEVRQESQLLLRTKTHTHDAPQALSYTFPAPGKYTVSITAFVAYPSAKAELFAPRTLVVPVVATAMVPGLPGLVVPDAPAAPDPPATNAVVVDDEGALSLVGTYDPWTTVGPTTQMHLSALAMDPATHAPVQHIDYKAELRDRLTGRILFSSASLHEYDGIWEFTAVQPPGQYVMAIEASHGHINWTARIEMPFAVLPTALPTQAGPVSYAVDLPPSPQAGAALQFGLHARDAARMPFAHSEIDLQVLDTQGASDADAGPVPRLVAKLHTHDSGDFAFTAALPAGDYVLRLSPTALEGQPVTFQGEGALGASLEVPLHVAAGAGFPALPAEAPAQQDAVQASPAPVVPLLVAFLAGAVLLRRR